MITIRHEKSSDIAAIHHVNEQAFNRPEEANLVDMLRAHGKVSLSLVAVEDDRIVGHILFSTVSIETAEKTVPAIGLAPMAVLPEFQCQGIGSLLVRSALAECREACHRVVVVLGHPGYYPRFGFVPSNRHGIKSEFDVPDEVFMVLELSEGALSGCAGTVKYQPEFNTFE
jgi:putative acetyltransferase